MTDEGHNSRAGEEQLGSSADNSGRQKRDSRREDKSNARDREGRKGGDNAENI
jgi:hypothetical protein